MATQPKFGTEGLEPVPFIKQPVARVASPPSEGMESMNTAWKPSSYHDIPESNIQGAWTPPPPHPLPHQNTGFSSYSQGHVQTPPIMPGPPTGPVPDQFGNYSEKDRNRRIAGVRRNTFCLLILIVILLIAVIGAGVGGYFGGKGSGSSNSASTSPTATQTVTSISAQKTMTVTSTAAAATITSTNFADVSECIYFRGGLLRVDKEVQVNGTNVKIRCGRDFPGNDLATTTFQNMTACIMWGLSKAPNFPDAQGMAYGGYWQTLQDDNNRGGANCFLKSNVVDLNGVGGLTGTAANVAIAVFE